MRLSLWWASWLLVLGSACQEAKEPTVQDAGAGARAKNAQKDAAVRTAPAGPPLRDARRDEVERMIEELADWVRPGATDPENAWAMAHGLVGFSKELKAKDGRRVVDVLVRDFATTEELAGRRIYGFPFRTAEGIPVEPHPDLIVKTLVEVGVPLTRRFSVKDSERPITLEQLVDDAAWAFKVPKNDRDWQKYAWSLELFLKHPGIDGSIKSHTGVLKVASLAQQGLGRLEKEQDFLRPLHRAGRPDALEKRRQGIYAHSCGGIHFVTAGVNAAWALGNPADKRRAKTQLDLLTFRWDGERRIYQQMIHQQAKYRWPLRIQELKFYGHVLEALADAVSRTDLFAADKARVHEIGRQVTADLIDAIIELRPLYRAQDNVKVTARQSYYDLIGDGCHALRGLKRALVAFFPG